jgi:hypothetical protein
MSMNYLNEGKRYYRCRYPNIDEDLIIERDGLLEQNEILTKEVNNLKEQIELIKSKIISYESKSR